MSEDLTARLLRMGAPEYSARKASEALAEGDPIPLLRSVLLASLWSEVVDEGQPPEWIQRWHDLGSADFPFIDAHALKRVLGAGVDPQDLTDVVRSAQALMLYNVAQMLGDGWRVCRDRLGTSAPPLTWGLVALDPAAENPSALGALHEEFGEYDPSGRGGAPRKQPAT